MTFVIPKFEGEYRFLSNFYPAVVSFDAKNVGNITFATGEHMFQALKYKAMLDESKQMDYIEAINASDDPNWAKKRGRAVKIDLAKWDAMKIDMMRQTVWAKFAQHDDLRIRLLDTGPAMLVEGNTWGDEFWGRCNGRGFNMLGVILMEVRGAHRWNGATQKWSNK